MKINNGLSQEKLLEILIKSYLKGQEDIKVLELIEEIKKDFLSVNNAEWK